MIKIAPYVKKLLLDFPYYGTFLCGVNKKESTKHDTAWVALNGINYELCVNPKFWEPLTDNEKKGLLMHETLHLCFMHVDPDCPIRKLAKDPELFNIACDLEVQSYVPKDWYITREGEYVGTADALRKQLNIPTQMGTKWYLDYLTRMQELMQQLGNAGSKNQGGGDKESQENQSGSSGQESQNDNSQAGDGQNGGQKKKRKVIDTLKANSRAEWDFDNLSNEEKQQIKEMLQNGISEHSEWGKAELTESIKKLIKDQLIHQIEQTAELAKGCSILPSEMGPIWEIITTKRKPVFDWKRYFRRFLGTSFDVNQRKTRRKQSNRFEDSPGMVLRKKHNILVAVDVSGSINRKEYDEFFNELHYVYKAGAKIKVIEVNTDIVTEYDYKGVTPAPHAGGGTSFLPAIDYYNKHRSLYSTMVYFTDGESWDVNECKPLGRMLWVISSRGNQRQDYPGVKICIPKD